MIVINDRADSRPVGKRRRGARGVTALLLAAMAGCTSLDELLSVDLPGDVEAGDLEDPRMAPILVNSAQADFECALVDYIWVTGHWTDEVHDASQSRPQALFSTRASSSSFYADHCTGTMPNFAPLQTSRAAAEQAIRLISGFPAGSVTNPEFLMAKANLYAGYSYVLLGEAYCELAFDAGPRKTREDSWKIAAERFTATIDLASKVTSGANAAEARNLVNAALVGRARASLNLGDRAAVVRDASRVPDSFVYYALYDESPSRRENELYVRNHISRSISVGRSFQNLTVDGVPDPRVAGSYAGRVGSDGITPLWLQQKYTSRGADIPLASGREALLMVAEAEGGQTAVNVINRLRATYKLPQFSSADPAQIRAQVLDERRRELFMQGVRIGDMIRTGQPWPTPVDHRGRAYEANTCMPIPDYEKIGNSNFQG